MTTDGLMIPFPSIYSLRMEIGILMMLPLSRLTQLRRPRKLLELQHTGSFSAPLVLVDVLVDGLERTLMGRLMELPLSAFTQLATPTTLWEEHE